MRNLALEGCVMVSKDIDPEIFKQQFFDFLDARGYNFAGLIGELDDEGGVNNSIYVIPTLPELTPASIEIIKILVPQEILDRELDWGFSDDGPSPKTLEAFKNELRGDGINVDEMTDTRVKELYKKFFGGK